MTDMMIIYGKANMCSSISHQNFVTIDQFCKIYCLKRQTERQADTFEFYKFLQTEPS